MNMIWNKIDQKSWKKSSKYTFTLWIFSILAAALGLILWAVIRTFALKSIDWMLCFAGYPVVFSWFLVFFYSFRHGFHHGSPKKA